MKTITILSTLIAASISFTANAKTAQGGTIEAEFNREVGAVCYVTQSNKVEGKLTFSNEEAAPESIEVFSNTGKIGLEYEEVKVNDGNFDKKDINFSINNDEVTLGDEVEVNQGLIDLGMSIDKKESDFDAGSQLSATATLIIECEDTLSDGNGNNGNGQCPDGEKWDKDDQECDD